MRSTAMIPALVFCVASCVGIPFDRNLLDAQTDPGQSSIEDPTLRNFDPQPTLKVASTKLTKSKYPVIDIHSHFGFRLKGDRAELESYVRVMDSNNIAVSVSLDAKLGDEEDHLRFIGQGYEKRIAAFVHLDFIGSGKKDDPKSWACNQAGFVRMCVEQLRASPPKGILGVKFFKSFGWNIKTRMVH